MIDPRAAAAIAEMGDRGDMICVCEGGKEDFIEIVRRHFSEPDPLLAKLEALATDWEATAYKIEVQHGITGKTYAAELRKLIAEYNP